MMLPNSPPPKSPMPATWPTTVAAPTRTARDNPVHADYNLQPLQVRSLEHYVVLDDEERERFHIR